MKTIYLIASCLLLTGMIGCKKQPGGKFSGTGCNLADTVTAPCILNMISQLQQQPVRNPAATVYSYTYNSQQVYYITADCCDQYNLLYDGNCNLICSPDGGIAGHGDGKCADFFTVRMNERLVWKDAR